MGLISTNYEVIQVSAEDADNYKVGQVFHVPEYYRNNWRFMAFDSLEIKCISFGFGVFLHFDYFEWMKNKEK